MLRTPFQQKILGSAEQGRATFRFDVLSGLSANPKQLPCKYFYDRRGSTLFDAICKLDEYYLTRTELKIMVQSVGQIAHALGNDLMLMELGSGSSVKTRILLDHLPDVSAYVPIDISRKHLFATARKLSQRYPAIVVQPVCADFTHPVSLPNCARMTSRRVVYFPGSTIGNFQLQEAEALLDRIAALCGEDGGLLIGIDLEKDPTTIEAAYNDSQGITARFNLNLLRRINRELGGNFDLDQFEHLAFYDAAKHRMDIRIVSRRRQLVEIDSSEFDFRAGEYIQTEYSHKYTVRGFEQQASKAGFRLARCWSDERRYFAILYFTLS